MLESRIKIKDLDETIIGLCIIDGGLLARKFEKIMAHRGLTFGDFSVLRQLYVDKGEMNLRSVKSATILFSGASITKVTDKLVKKGYINRRENPLSRREKLVKITPSGERLAEDVIRDARKQYGAILAGLNRPAKEQTAKALKLMTRNILEMK